MRSNSAALSRSYETSMGISVSERNCLRRSSLPAKSFLRICVCLYVSGWRVGSTAALAVKCVPAVRTPSFDGAKPEPGSAGFRRMKLMRSSADFDSSEMKSTVCLYESAHFFSVSLFGSWQFWHVASLRSSFWSFAPRVRSAPRATSSSV
jgi:hypothetical protein